MGWAVPVRPKDWEDAIYRWYKEEKDFKYGSGSTNNRTVGHYTQVLVLGNYT